MSTTAAQGRGNAPDAQATRNDLKLEVIIIPVADVERAKAFYGSLGWRLDADFAFDGGFRAVQYTPPGSACSVQFGSWLTKDGPGSTRAYLVVSDIAATRAELVARGVDVSEVFHPESPGAQFGTEVPANGPAPNHGTYGSYAVLQDPDGNRWLLQEVTTRLPGRVDTNTTAYTSAPDLATPLRRAAAAHGEHEKRIGGPDANWPDWYASYMVAEQNGKGLPT